MFCSILLKTITLILFISMINGIKLPCSWHLNCESCTANPDCTWCLQSYNIFPESGCVDSNLVNETRICIADNLVEFSSVASNPKECSCITGVSMNMNDYCHNCTSNPNCGYYSVWGEDDLIVCTGITFNFTDGQYDRPVYTSCP